MPASQAVLPRAGRGEPGPAQLPAGLGGGQALRWGLNCQAGGREGETAEGRQPPAAIAPTDLRARDPRQGSDTLLAGSPHCWPRFALSPHVKQTSACQPCRWASHYSKK
ncbi:hypothetical protein AOLI_G00000700 [Acnodon oligacanthus]